MNRKPTAALLMLAGAVACLAGACTTARGLVDRSAYEESPYASIERGGIEFRRYGSRVAADATVEVRDGDVDAARSKAFRLLFDYITGENEARADVAMTTPVETATERSANVAMTVPVEIAEPSGSSQVSMRFFAPAESTMQTAPRPTNPAVRLVEVPTQFFAAKRLEGRKGDDAVLEAKATLARELDAIGVEPLGPPVVLYYDPPLTPALFRRVEVLVPVSRPPY